MIIMKFTICAVLVTLFNLLSDEFLPESGRFSTWFRSHSRPESSRGKNSDRFNDLNQIFQIESEASPQITKFAPVEDWIAFKRRTSDIKPLEKLLEKLRATYDFVFPKPENVTNVEKILSSDNSRDTEPYKLILSTSQMTNNDENEKEDVELLPDEMIPTKESSISRVATDWLDDVEVQPLGELELLNNDNIDSPVVTVSPQSSFELPVAVARAFIRWLTSIIGFTHGAYLKITNSTDNS